MRIGFYELEDWEEEVVKQAFPQEELFLSREKFDPQNPGEAGSFEIVSTFINTTLDETALKAFSSLKLIVTRSTGFDHIDVEAAKKKGVVVSNVPGYGENTVAEYTFGLILALTRKIYQAIDRVKESSSFNLEGLRGIDLKNKTLGVVGTGRIGKEVIRIASGFSMNVIAFDPYPNLSLGQELNFQYVNLNDLLSRSDILTIHCPANKDTYHLLNKENVKLMKRGAYLVNTARGNIVETEALVQALKEGVLGGAALDVLEEEGEIKDELDFLKNPHPQEEVLKTILYNHVLMGMPQVLISPHNAFNSREALGRILETSIEDIKSFLSGKSVNVVS